MDLHVQECQICLWYCCNRDCGWYFGHKFFTSLSQSSSLFLSFLHLLVPCYSPWVPDSWAECAYGMSQGADIHVWVYSSSVCILCRFCNHHVGGYPHGWRSCPLLDGRCHCEHGLVHLPFTQLTIPPTFWRLPSWWAYSVLGFPHLPWCLRHSSHGNPDSFYSHEHIVVFQLCVGPALQVWGGSIVACQKRNNLGTHTMMAPQLPAPPHQLSMT